MTVRHAWESSEQDQDCVPQKGPLTGKTVYERLPLERNSVSDHFTEREAPLPGRGARPLPDGEREPQAATKSTSLWQPGVLFHVSSRYPRRPDAARVDRLAGILRTGLVAPGCCQD